MKALKRNTFKVCFLILCAYLTSCAPKYYYQILNVGHNEEIKNNSEQGLFYEDENISIAYDFSLVENGNTMFVFSNKTDSIIRIYLDESFFIRNGLAFNYYENVSRSYGKTKTISLSSSNSTAAMATLSKNISNSSYFNITARNISLYDHSETNTLEMQTIASKSMNSEVTNTSMRTENEMPYILLPPLSSKFIGGAYLFSPWRFTNEALEEFPKRRNTENKLDFNEQNTPLTIRNYITYQVGTGKKHHIDNAFYVKSIHNYNGKDVFEKRIVREGNKDVIKTTWHINIKPDMIYILY